jgi:hypothetical protein
MPRRNTDRLRTSKDYAAESRGHRNANPRNQRETEARERALAALARMRREGRSLRAAATAEGTSPGTVKRYVGSALRQEPGGHYRPTPRDRIVRELLFPMASGDLPVRTRSSQDATMLSEFFHDRDKLLRGELSSNSFEEKWRGKRVAGRELFADAAEILRMGEADVLPLESLYASTTGER